MEKFLFFKNLVVTGYQWNDFEYYLLTILLLSEYLLLFFEIIINLKRIIKFVLENISTFKEKVNRLT